MPRASIRNLLAERASRGLARFVSPLARAAARAGLPLRLDEFNSVSCGGHRRVGDSFASSLWMLDTLFELARSGVSGVNVHTLSRAFYTPFRFKRTTTGWIAHVAPVYYGMLLFRSAAPAGARLLRTRQAGPRRLKIWATVDPRHVIRVVLINKDVTRPTTVRVRIPGAHRQGRLQRLAASGARSTKGITLAGQSFGASSRDARLHGRRTVTVTTARHGTFSIPMPAASAAMLTLRSAR